MTERVLGLQLECSLYSSSGAAAAALPVPTDFWLFISLLKSKICVKVVHPFIILSISVQSVLLPSVVSSLGEWYRYTLNNERMQFSNTNFGFPKSKKQQIICRHSEGSSCCTTWQVQCRFWAKLLKSGTLLTTCVMAISVLRLNSRS